MRTTGKIDKDLNEMRARRNEALYAHKSNVVRACDNGIARLQAERNARFLYLKGFWEAVNNSSVPIDMIQEFNTAGNRARRDQGNNERAYYLEGFHAAAKAELFSFEFREFEWEGLDAAGLLEFKGEY